MKYSVEWKGLDQGVEHTWTPEVIITGLKLIKKYQPLAHRNPESPFYKSMEAEFPDKTWRAFDSKDDSFRPIFRRSNTWKKLGLITESDKEFSVSLTGKKLLLGEIGLDEVYANICSNHVENNEKPFVVLASLLTAFGVAPFSIDEVMFYLHHWRPDCGESPTEVKSNYKQLEPDYLQGSEYLTRRRRVSAMLKLFNSMNVVSKDGKNYRVNNSELLLEIAIDGQLDGGDLRIEITEDSSNVNKSETSNSPSNRRSVKLNRTINDYTALASKTSDPEQRLRLLERATRKHEETIEAYARIVRDEFGLDTYENSFGYDLYTEINESAGILLEVKTVNSTNYAKQIREAVSQLHEYNYRFKNEFKPNNQLVILLDINAQDFIPKWMYDYLVNDRKIFLWWIDNGKVQPSHLSKRIDELLR